MPRLFISHSSQDRDFVETRLRPLLHRHGLDTWYSKEDIRSAARWEKCILEGLKACDWFLVVVSENSINSPWVQTEVDWALEHREGRVVPVVIQRCDPTELHLKLRQIQRVDFHKDGESAVRRLLEIWNIEPEGVKDRSAGEASVDDEVGVQEGETVVDRPPRRTMYVWAATIITLVLVCMFVFRGQLLDLADAIGVTNSAGKQHAGGERTQQRLGGEDGQADIPDGEDRNAAITAKEKAARLDRDAVAKLTKEDPTTTAKQDAEIIAPPAKTSINIVSDLARPSAADGSADVFLWITAATELTGPEAGITDLDFAPDADVIAAASQDGTGHVWNLRNADPSVVLRGHDGPIDEIAVGPKGDVIATRGADTTVRLWEGRTGAELKNLGSGLRQFALSSSGRTIAIANESGDISLVDAVQAVEFASLAAAGDVVALALSPDDKLLAVARQNAIEVWSVTALNKEHSRPAEHPEGLRFSGDGQQLYYQEGTSVKDVTARPPPSLLPEAVLSEPLPRSRQRTGYDSYVSSRWLADFDLSADDRLLVTARGEQKKYDSGRVERSAYVRVEANGGSRDGETLLQFDSEARCIALASDGARLAVARDEPTITLYELTAIPRSQLGGPDREAAEWVLSVNGVVQVATQSLPEVQVSSRGELPNFPFWLRSIVLTRNEAVTDEDLERLTRLPRLESLMLTLTFVSDAGLEHLAPIKSLTELQLKGTKVTQEGVAKLKRLLPHCRIVIE